MDRNLSVAILISGSMRSLSARRAWIEIDIDDKFAGLMSGRSPQGERG